MLSGRDIQFIFSLLHHDIICELCRPAPDEVFSLTGVVTKKLGTVVLYLHLDIAHTRLAQHPKEEVHSVCRHVCKTRISCQGSYVQDQAHHGNQQHNDGERGLVKGDRMHRRWQRQG